MRGRQTASLSLLGIGTRILQSSAVEIWSGFFDYRRNVPGVSFVESGYRVATEGFSRVGLRTLPSQHCLTRREHDMSDRNSGPESAAKGIAEEIKGRAKRAYGSLTGNEDLQEEGRAQEQKADAQRDVARREAQAERSRAEAEAREAEQRAHQ